jgi:hypothetical protein
LLIVFFCFGAIRPAELDCFMRSSILLFAALFIVFSSVAQREPKALYVPGGQFKNTGWFIAPGLAFTLPFPRNEQLSGYTVSDDTIYKGDFARDGQNGLCFQLGRHHFWKRRGPIDHVDYGLGYKMLRGTEEFVGQLNTSNGFVGATYAAAFSDSYLSAFGNMSNVLMLSNRWWIQNSLGLNIDFRLFGKRSGGGLPGLQWYYPPTFPVQLHYRVGFGWKPEPGIFILPMIEIPLLNVNRWEGMTATLPYFNGRFRPVLITLRIQWLSKQEDRQCENQPGRNVDLSRGGKHDENDLFGPDARKMKRKKRK